MKKNLIALLFLGIAVAGLIVMKQSATTLTVLSSKSNPVTLPIIETTKKQSEFNFIFKYGPRNLNIMNTYNNTYQKDLDPNLISTTLVLTEKEKADIYNKIKDLGVFENNNGVDLEPACRAFNGSVYYIKTVIDSTEKELAWNDCPGFGSVTKTPNGDIMEREINPGGVRKKLLDFSYYVVNIIESHEEYKLLPTPSVFRL